MAVSAGSAVPKARWATAISSRRDAARLLPQTIAHRGYKAAWPENSMAAFKGAVDVGAHAIETDVHLSKDGVVVLSHDPSLKRCFGVDKRISECNWDYLSTLQTTREPKQSLPRLADLLQWLEAPEREKIWVLLDIKIDDDADDLVNALSQTFTSTTANKPWNQRIVLGCWNATYIQTVRRLLPTYPLAHITYYLPYAHHFFHPSLPQLGYNIHHRCLLGWAGARFLRRARDEDRQVFAWTVNEERWMRWCINRNVQERQDLITEKKSRESKPLLESQDEEDDDAGVQSGFKLIDGVITDDPKLFLEVCEKWEDELDGKRAPHDDRLGLVQSMKFIVQQAMLRCLAAGLFFHRRFVQRTFDLLPRTKKP